MNLPDRAVTQLTVYAIAPSLYCAKLRILLRHKGLSWQEQSPPGGYGSAEYKSIVSSGNLPALVDAGLLIADSEAIAEYLNERHPTPAMLPGSIAARAQCRERSRFHDTRLEPALRQCFAHIAPAGRDPGALATLGNEVNTRLQQYGQILTQQSPDSSELTLADCGYPISFAWIDALTPVLSLPIQWPQVVLQWRNDIERHEAVATELAAYQPVLEQYVARTSHG